MKQGVRTLVLGIGAIAVALWGCSSAGGHGGTGYDGGGPDGTVKFDGGAGTGGAAVDARTTDVSPAVDTNVISDVPIADEPIAIDLPVTSEAKMAPDAAVCSQLAQAAQAQADSYLQSTPSLACQADSDCSLLDLRSLNCFAPCGQLVRTADVSTVTAAIATACNEYFGAGCPERMVPCLPFHVVCDQGTCAGSPGGAGLSGSTDAAVDAATGDVSIDGTYYAGGGG